MKCILLDTLANKESGIEQGVMMVEVALKENYEPWL
jgi:hypothetical protein